MARVWELDIPNATAKLILLCLADCMNAETGRCFPSRKYIANACSCSEATVKRQLAELESAGFIKREPRFIDGRQTSSMYMLHIGEFEGGVQIAPPGGSPATPHVTGIVTETYSTEFEAARKSGPHHPNDHKKSAYKKWVATINKGAAEADLAQAWRDYVTWAQSGGASDPRFMMHMKTFFGPDEHWRRAWQAVEQVPEDRAGILALARKHNVALSGDITLPQARQTLAKQLGMRL